MAEDITAKKLIALTVEIVSAHVSNNSMLLADLPTLVQNVHASLAALGREPVGSAARPHPAVPIKRSVAPDYIICLEDGKKLKMLKRHLRTTFNMTPEQYRKRWSLPSTYPMVAPRYAEERSRLAKAIGLGTRRTRRGR